MNNYVVRGLAFMFKDDEIKTPKEIIIENDLLELLIQDDNRKVLLVALAQLPVREEGIVELYLGMHSAPKTFEEIGKIFRISGGRTRQLFKRGLERLRRLLSSMGYF